MNQVTLARYKASRHSENSELLDNDIVKQSKWVGKMEKTVEMVGQRNDKVQMVWHNFTDLLTGGAK